MVDKNGDIYERISDELLQKLNSLEVGEDDFWVVQSDDYELNAAYELKDKLLKQFEGFKIDEVFDGVYVKNDYGSCFLIERREKLKFELIDKQTARKNLIEDLTLVSGIREKRKKQLMELGYKDLYSLKQHHLYGKEAKKVLELLENVDLEQFVDYVHNRYRNWSSLAMLYSSAFLKPEDFLFFDIETLGIYAVMVILIGIGYFEGDEFVVKQFLVLEPEQEAAALSEFVKYVNSSQAFVSFNGRAFDVNFIRQRLVYNSIYEELDLIHFDVYLFAKKFWKDVERIENFKLKTLEKVFLNVERVDDVPSDLVPEFYLTYSETGNIGPLVPIIIHNQQDIISTAKLFALMHKQISDGSASIRNSEEQ